STSGYSDYISHSDYLATPTSGYSGYIGHSDHISYSDYTDHSDIRSLRLYRLFCQHTADNETLDFVCPFIDLGNLGIAHVAFDRIIFRVTITAKYLDGFSRDTHRGIPGK